MTIARQVALLKWSVIALAAGVVGTHLLIAAGRRPNVEDRSQNEWHRDANADPATDNTGIRRRWRVHHGHTFRFYTEAQPTAEPA